MPEPSTVFKAVITKKIRKIGDTVETNRCFCVEKHLILNKYCTAELCLSTEEDSEKSQIHDK
jgi:hypothetical protein